MALKDKKRAVSFILNMAIITATDTIITTFIKTTISKISKSEPFAGSRYKFKVFCTQIRLGV
jgi:hypothetical protein